LHDPQKRVKIVTSVETFNSAKARRRKGTSSKDLDSVPLQHLSQNQCITRLQHAQKGVALAAEIVNVSKQAKNVSPRTQGKGYHQAEDDHDSDVVIMHEVIPKVMVNGGWHDDVLSELMHDIQDSNAMETMNTLQPTRLMNRSFGTKARYAAGESAVVQELNNAVVTLQKNDIAAKHGVCKRPSTCVDDERDGDGVARKRRRVTFGRVAEAFRKAETYVYKSLYQLFGGVLPSRRTLG
jgi:hypothetical protein